MDLSLKCSSVISVSHSSRPATVVVLERKLDTSSCVDELLHEHCTDLHVRSWQPASTDAICRLLQSLARKLIWSAPVRCQATLDVRPVNNPHRVGNRMLEPLPWQSVPARISSPHILPAPAFHQERGTDDGEVQAGVDSGIQRVIRIDDPML